MLTALVVDDEPPARRLLRELLQGRLQVVGEAGSGVEALQQVETLRPEVVFLDVQMPELDGLETARQLAASAAPPRVVFVTAYDEHALEAFDVAAVDYLLKPVEPERLERTLERLRRTEGAEDLGRLVRALRVETLRRLALLDEPSGVRHVVDLAQVVYISCEDEKTYVRLPDRVLRSMETLGGLEALLPPSRFLRVHRSFLINLERVTRVEPWGAGTFHLELTGSDRPVPLSRQYAARFKERVGWL